MAAPLRLGFVLGFVLVGCGHSASQTSDSGTPFAGDDMGQTCGNGMIDPGEMCDDGPGNGTVGDPCTINCSWVCTVDSNCDDKNPCNGVETCGSTHVCKPGTAPTDGTSCGSGMLCRGGTCIAATCGDGIVTSPEECDDGNKVNGDGCDNNCKFSCVTGDATRNCTPTDSCAGQGTCGATHVCAPGTPKPDNTTCAGGPHNYCKAGKCTTPVCGNGVVEPGEQCDDGGLNGTKADGCNAMCAFACVTPATDCGALPPCEKQSCTTAHVCQAVADPALDGQSCGTGLICKSGACISPTAVCGNGVVEPGEDCDLGTKNGPGTGCESNCKFSCTVMPNSCDDGNPCNGVETCVPTTATSSGGATEPVQKCQSGTAQPDGTACGTGKICLTKVCQMSRCGDGFVDPGAGETCEPPNTSTCDSMCHKIVCGDGVRSGTEQCDDGNTVNLDGCDSMCRFEQDHRVNSLTMQFGTDTDCSPNALGGAIASAAQATLQDSLTKGVQSGAVSVLFKMFGLTDLTGTSGAAVQLGVMHAKPVMATGYDGNNDLDWWYTVDPVSIDANRNPTAFLSGSITTQKLTATGASITLTLILAGSTASLTMTNVRMIAYDGAVSAPTMSTGATPGHLASENLDPALMSFGATGGASGTDKLCGNIAAASLSKVPAPAALIMGGSNACTEGYTSANSLLDVLVGGCHVTILLFTVTAITPTQPDMPAAMGGDTYTLGLDGNNKVATCMKNGAAQPDLNACLSAAGYSSYFQFTTDRVIVK